MSDLQENPKSFGDLLALVRIGNRPNNPVLIRVDANTPISEAFGSFDNTVDQTLELGSRLDWEKQYALEYGDNHYIELLPQTQSAGSRRITIGRSRKCDVRIENDSISKHHCSIVYQLESGEYSVVDENSRNGTTVNGEKLRAGVYRSLWSGAYVSLASEVFVFIDPPTLRKLARAMA